MGNAFLKSILTLTHIMNITSISINNELQFMFLIFIYT